MDLFDAPADGSSHPAGADRTAAFHRAQRHSHFVRVLKYTLPSLAVLLAVGFVTKSYLSTVSPVAIVAEATAVSDGKLVMANPKLDGFTAQNLPYSLNAMRAVQDIANDSLIQLQEIGAKLPLSASNLATIISARGDFDRTANRLTVTTPIDISTTDGVQAHLKSAVLDLAAGSMTTAEPVHISQDGNSIAADSMSVTEHGKVVVFENQVRVTIVPPKRETASQ
jgi:lipopolysaccharide export system protein LptC